ncbi:EAL domain-containing protein [Massilia sp. TWP1-3-3]|uniref:EAL domain-containing protein n=1 Tax=Massilia sp. TWP1-3-3 TaxID=2804573 RepID=UPI003CF3E555
MGLEITEGLLLASNSAVMKQLLAFQQAGIKISLDDFGTGYSSLSYLRKFDLDYLKIDKSFVYNLENDAANVALCEAIIVMAHKLNLKVIAEGVETQQQYDVLRSAGCDYGQGFLFSVPLPPAEFEALLRQEGAVAA